VSTVCVGAVWLVGGGVVAEMVGIVVKTLVLSMSPAMLIDGVGQGRTSCADGDESLQGVSKVGLKQIRRRHRYELTVVEHFIVSDLSSDRFLESLLVFVGREA